MSTTNEDEERKSREGAWARPVGRLKVGGVPAGAINLNVEGRQLTGPLKGFGQMWQKTYKVKLAGAGVTPQEVIKTWKAQFPEFWPRGNYFYGSLTGIAPGDVAVLNLAAPAGMPLSTGVLVIYADDESFAFMTPQGHMFAGMITFSAYEEDGIAVAQIQVLIRASDPIYEMGCRLGVVHKAEDSFWQGTLQNLALHFGAGGRVEQQNALLDPKMQWREAKNVWHNAAVRTALYTPVYLVRRVFKR